MVTHRTNTSLFFIDQIALKLCVFEERVGRLADSAEAAKTIMRSFASHHSEVQDNGQEKEKGITVAYPWVAKDKWNNSFEIWLERYAELLFDMLACRLHAFAIQLQETYQAEEDHQDWVESESHFVPLVLKVVVFSHTILEMDTDASS